MLRSRISRGLGRLRFSLLHQFVLLILWLGLLLLWKASLGQPEPKAVLRPVDRPIAEDNLVTASKPVETTAHVSKQRKVLCKFKPIVNVSATAGRGQTALITGVAGFIGSHVAAYCINNLGLTVIGLDDLSSGKLKNVPSGVQFIHTGFGDSKQLHRLFASYRFDLVYHLAGHGGELISHNVRSFTYKNELVASSNLLNAVVRAGGTQNFVYLSTASVYGESSSDSGVGHTETSATEPLSPMANAKLAFEHDLRAAQRSFGLSYTVLRAHNVYGPVQNLQDPYHSVVSSFIRQHLNPHRTKPITIYGEGTQTRSFTYISDIVPMISFSAFIPAAENQVINIGNDELVSINKLKEIIGEALGRPREALHVSSRAEPRVMKVDHTKMRCIFGAWPMTTLDHGLSKLLPHIMASFSGKDDIQSLLAVRHVVHVEVKQGLDSQSWDGHEVDEVHAMQVTYNTDDTNNNAAAAAGGGGGGDVRKLKDGQLPDN